MFLFKREESPMWAALRSLATSFKPGGIIDIGANVGDWSRSASQIFSCPFHLIEAQAELEPHLRESGFAYTIALLGPEFRDAVPFHLSGTGSSVLEELTTFEKSETTLAMHRLDDVDIGLPGPLLLKLDVQGFELQVLNGATETLRRTEVILSEVSLLPYNKEAPLMHEVVAYLAERDFLPFDLCGGWRRSSDNALAQTDIIFVKRNSDLRAHRKFWDCE